MLVKLRVPAQGPDCSYPIGSTFELDDEVAAEMLRNGDAELPEGPAPAAVPPPSPAPTRKAPKK